MQVNKSVEPRPGATPIATTQLNIVTTVDIANTLRSGSLEGNAAVMDNSAKSTGKGTAALKTVCNPGQVLNWLIYARDMQQLPDNSWPPSARIVNIVFLNNYGEARQSQVCSPLKVFGGPGEILDPATPVYYYWAGQIIPLIPPGIYKYRLVIELETFNRSEKKYFNFDGPALDIRLPPDPSK